LLVIEREAIPTSEGVELSRNKMLGAFSIASKAARIAG
jgi:hypothetical protein